VFRTTTLPRAPVSIYSLQNKILRERVEMREASTEEGPKSGEFLYSFWQGTPSQTGSYDSSIITLHFLIIAHEVGIHADTILTFFADYNLCPQVNFIRAVS
jgi:hypothetical protein